MDGEERGLYHAWEALLMDFEEVLVGSSMDGGWGRQSPQGAVFDRPFSIVKLFHHPGAELGLELRADGRRAVLSLFRPDPTAEDGSHAGAAELGTVRVHYDDLLDAPDDVLARVVALLPPL